MLDWLGWCASYYPVGGDVLGYNAICANYRTSSYRYSASDYALSSNPDVIFYCDGAGFVTLLANWNFF